MTKSKSIKKNQKSKKIVKLKTPKITKKKLSKSKPRKNLSKSKSIIKITKKKLSKSKKSRKFKSKSRTIKKYSKLKGGSNLTASAIHGSGEKQKMTNKCKSKYGYKNNKSEELDQLCLELYEIKHDLNKMYDNNNYIHKGEKDKMISKDIIQQQKKLKDLKKEKLKVFHKNFEKQVKNHHHSHDHVIV